MTATATSTVANVSSTSREEDRSPPGPPFCQSLNAMDCTMLAVNQALRGLGGSGFETQAVVRLKGRIDPARLQSALAHLSLRHPVMASRLRTIGHEPMWRGRQDAMCGLQEVTINSSCPDAVLAHASRLLSLPRDLSSSDPISFHLIHLPHARDVFLMQYNHVLMDNIAASRVLRKIDRAVRFRETVDDAPDQQHDLLGDYLARFKRTKQLQAAFRTVRLRLQSLRGASVQLGRRRTGEGQFTLSIVTRTFDQEATSRLRAKLMEQYRFPLLSMALLASTFRAIQVLSPCSINSDRYIAGIGLDLGVRRAEWPLFQNLVSLVPIRADGTDLHDHDRLIRLLNSQMQQRLRERIDLGVIVLSQMFRRLPSFVRWSMTRLMQHGYSCWYAYFESPDAVDQTFCGEEVEELRYIGPAWAPLGLTLLVNQSQGRLLFQATCIPELVSQAVAEDFLDWILADLRSISGQPTVAASQ